MPSADPRTLAAGVWGGSVFGLPPGAAFPEAFVAGLLRRMDGRPPEALARVTVFVNSGRMARRVRAAFGAHGPRLLPRIRLVTDLDAFDVAGLPPALSRLDMVLDLAGLVAGLVDRYPDLAPRSAVVDLAESLADLFDEMAGEGVGPEALAALDVGAHAAHWQRSRAIVEAAHAHFAARPDRLPGAEARRRAIVSALGGRWAEAPPHDPVIVAGSTGSRGATRALMEAVARLPNGALVLPGYDFDLPEAMWATLDRAIEAEDHPQFRFRPLLDVLGLGPGDVAAWEPGTAPDAGRNRLISLALRPAPVTDAWRREGAALPDPRELTAGLTLIEAPGPAREAEAIALCLRRALEEGKRAALVTPDRVLARRVEAALDRWRLIPDDSAGVPLNETAPGRLLRQIAGFGPAGTPLAALLALLKHPLAASGSDRGEHLRQTRDLELALRRKRLAQPDAAAILHWAAARKERGAWAEWVADWLAAAARLPQAAPLAAHAAAHLALAEALAAGQASAGPGGLWDGEPGRAARTAMATLEAATADTPLSAMDYARLLDRHLGAVTVTRPELPRADLMIWGTLEARAQGADLVVLAGLTEGTWPGTPAPDPWLNRAMRAEAGLLLPERQIGLAAHDFQQAAGAAEVVLSRALRDDEAETVPSRWLNRLTNLLDGLDARGKEALDAMRARGAALLDLAAALAQPRPEDMAPPEPRPAPCPPLALRPRELPVTAITRLNRDPYEIYGRHVLNLKKLDPLAPEPDARVRGTALHRIVDRFVKERDRWLTEDDATARAVLAELAADELGAATADRGMAAFWQARLDAVAARIIDGERLRLARGTPVLTEEGGGLPLDGLHFRLTARPDRIDRLTDGRYAIYDYKSGSPPTEKQVDKFDKQLVLEAALLERGGFDGLSGTVERMAYIPLGAGEKAEAEIGVEDDSGARRPDVAWADLHRLIAVYGLRETGYVSRRAPEEIRFDGDYDQLARFGEWSVSDPPVPVRVGPDDPA